jgi:hypothetical protein
MLSKISIKDRYVSPKRRAKIKAIPTIPPSMMLLGNKNTRIDIAAKKAPRVIHM